MLKQMRYWFGPRRPWLWLLLALLLYTLMGFLLAPWLVERQLTRISAERAELTTSIETIDINPFLLTLNVEGLDVIDSDSSALLSLERLFINFKLASVVRRTWSFDEFHVIGLDVALERFSDGSTNVGVVADRWAATSASESEPPEDGGPPRLVIADLVVDSATMSVVDNVPATRFETRIDPLNLSVENLSTLPDETGDQALILSFANGAVLTWSGASSLNPLQSEGRVTLEGAYPGLIHTYFRDQLAFDMSGGELIARLNYSAGFFADNAFSADIYDIQFHMSDTVLSDLDDGETLANLPRIIVEDGELYWPANTVTLGAVQLQGFDLHAVRQQDGSINLIALLEEMAAEWRGAGDPDFVETGDEAEPWQIGVGELTLDDWQITFQDQMLEQGATIELGLNATLADISSVPDSQMLLSSTVDVANGGSLALGGSLMALPQLQFDGEVSLDDLELNLLQPYIDPIARIVIEQGRLAGIGEVTMSDSSMSFLGDMSINDLDLTDRVENEALFGIDNLQLNGITLQQNNETRLDIDEIQLHAPYVRVEIEEDGSTNVGRVFVPSGSDEPGPDSDAGANGVETQEPLSGIAIAVGRVVVDAGRADFADWSLPLPFSVAMSGLGGDISSFSPESQQPAQIALEGQVGEFGAVTIGGELQPLDYLEQTQVDLVFRNIDMPTMSPYVIRFAGREIDNGRLDADLSYQIENARISGDNVLVMHDLVLGDRVPHPEAADLPLSLAVALLRDREGVINLDVPVSGDANDPQFNYGQVIRQAITNTLSNIVTSPFRFLANLVGIDDEEEMAVIEFDPGRFDVRPPQRQKLMNIADALEQRPQLELRVPPIYAQQVDEQALARNLLDQRIEALVSDREASALEEMSATARRIAMLEEIMVAERLAVDEFSVDGTEGDAPATGNEGQTSLAVLRLMHMMPESETGAAQLDESAYTEFLRNRLLEQQAVPPEELDELARLRAEQVLAVITQSRPELEAQIALVDSRQVSPGEDGQIGMTLELEVGGT